MKINVIKELSIQINLNGLYFCILNKTSNTVEFLKTVEFEHKLNPIDTLNRLKMELSSDTIFSEDFDAVLVIHQNELATLIPEELYNPEHKVDYLKFNSKILGNDFITEDKISVNKSINVYVPYVNINNYIFETFGEFIYKHSSSILIESVLQNFETSDEIKFCINVNKNTIEILVLEDNKLQLFNVFEYYSKEDFIYYVLFVFEQLKLDVETTLVELCGNIVIGDEIFSTLYTYIRHVNFIEKEYNFEITSDIDRRYLHQHYLILNSF
ncbi:DUF3822 family protein [Winogradskyella bathintestinalis]|uniref:DUF3822 family protein n=1 Tax=Winogradskyella bathintestinalis TaxID=3035208 RepID=A0ABT7ZXE4_9FLAO|nr:DUF3822 family protein [Winogradskyella bathintestinalis]MDN3493683.1 DUF3822 family protein [Winogradskyella bathintestinalis]